MTVRFFLLVLLAYCLLLECDVINGWKSNTNEYFQSRGQFNVLSKPVVKTIQTVYGDTYGCVDFYKQPAFDHPLLKNHSYHYQAKVNSHRIRKITKDSNASIQFSNIWLNGKGCPNGTVPIRRLTKDELTRANKNFRLYYPPIHGFSDAEPGVHYAILSTETFSNKKYNGAGMIASLHQPKVVAPQFSGCQMKIQGDSDFVQVGWMVNPNINVDSDTRLFIFTHTNQLHCFNLQCSGFVLTRSDFGVDHVLGPVSKPGGPITAYDFLIERDANGDWRLKVGPNKDEIGFWPKKIFTGLADPATRVQWGGEVYSPINTPSPVMGTGDIKDGDSDYESFCYQVAIIDENNKVVSVGDIGIKEIADSSAYRTKNGVEDDPKYGHIFFYGGKGGATGN